MSNFIMMIGLPASGKSFHALRIAERTGENTVIVSSDAIRKELFGDESCQNDNAKVFEIVHKRVKEACENEQDVILDATNLSRSRRIHFLESLNKYNVNKSAVLVMSSIEDIYKRNNARKRHVPESAIQKMYRSFNPPSYYEGFDEIFIISNFDNIDNVDTIEALQKKNSIPHDNPHHSLGCQEHCMEACKHMEQKITEFHLNSSLSYILRSAAEYHDISKFRVKAFCDYRGRKTKIAHYYGHENVSAYDFICAVCLEQNMGKNLLLEIANLISLHMHCFRGKSLEKLKKTYPEGFINKLLLLHECDKLAH